jgi:nucleotide-binding universal stress UspA family protein
MTKKILVPVDLAHEESWRVLPQALAEARLREAELHLIAVMPDFGSVLVADQFPQGFEYDMLQKARARLVELREQSLPADIPCEVHIGHGHAAEQIIAWADKLQVDLIILASRRPDALRTLFVGSVAEKIVRNANHSVLVVRD